MHLVSPWQNPIDVPLAANANVDAITLSAGLSYGLVATELVEPNWPEEGFPPRLLERVGLAQLTQTVLALEQTANVSDPVWIHARRLRQIVEDALVPVVAPILSAATESRTLDQTVGDGIIRFITVYGPKQSTPRRLRSNDRVVWGHTFKHLLDRAAVEVFELYALNSRLRRCCYCNCAFVPERDERSCRWNLWRWPARPGDLPLRYCSQARADAARRSTQTASSTTIYQRERKRLNAKVDRERKRAIEHNQDPSESPRVRAAQRELTDYIAQHGPPRGRKPTSLDTPDALPTHDAEA